MHSKKGKIGPDKKLKITHKYSFSQENKIMLSTTFSKIADNLFDCWPARPLIEVTSIFSILLFLLLTLLCKGRKEHSRIREKKYRILCTECFFLQKLDKKISLSDRFLQRLVNALIICLLLL